MPLIQAGLPALLHPFLSGISNAKANELSCPADHAKHMARAPSIPAALTPTAAAPLFPLTGLAVAEVAGIAADVLLGLTPAAKVGLAVLATLDAVALTLA